MKTYKAAVVGAGFIGAAHIEALRRLGSVEVAALCDACGAEEKAARWQVPAAYSDYKSMLEEVRPDVVHICTPNHTHYEIAKYAITRGIHFICEKPFTTTVEQALELAALAEGKGVVGAVNHHNRFYPMVAEMRERVQRGEAGRLFSVHGGYIQDWLLYDTDYTWRLDSAQVGKTRAIADIGSHWMDLAEYATGEKITRVNALFRTVHPIRKKPLGGLETFAAAAADTRYEEIGINTEDEAVLMLEFAGGAIGSAIISMVCAGRKNTTTLNIAGSQCSLAWNSEQLNELYIGRRDAPNQLLTKDPALLHPAAAGLSHYPSGHVEGFPDAFKSMFIDFYGSLAGGDAPAYATPRDGLHQMRLCEAVYQSALSGQWVDVAAMEGGERQ